MHIPITYVLYTHTVFSPDVSYREGHEQVDTPPCKLHAVLIRRISLGEISAYHGILYTCDVSYREGRPYTYIPPCMSTSQAGSRAPSRRVPHRVDTNTSCFRSDHTGRRFQSESTLQDIRIVEIPTISMSR
jgi:hypothetical protein